MKINERKRKTLRDFSFCATNERYEEGKALLDHPGRDELFLHYVLASRNQRNEEAKATMTQLKMNR